MAETCVWEPPLDLIESSDHVHSVRPYTTETNSMPQIALKTSQRPVVMNGPMQVLFAYQRILRVVFFKSTVLNMRV